MVVSGFSGAGFMIYQSFQDWGENPIKTAVETKPIKDLRFPKVTICPPKNSYTDLNFDLMMLKDTSKNEDMRNNLTRYAIHLLHVLYNIVFHFSLDRRNPKDISMFKMFFRTEAKN